MASLPSYTYARRCGHVAGETRPRDSNARARSAKGLGPYGPSRAHSPCSMGPMGPPGPTVLALWALWASRPCGVTGPRGPVTQFEQHGDGSSRTRHLPARAGVLSRPSQALL